MLNNTPKLDNGGLTLDHKYFNLITQKQYNILLYLNRHLYIPTANISTIEEGSYK